MAKAKDFKDQTIEELKLRYQELSKDLYLMRNEMKITRKMEKPHLVREKKKERARLMTALREKEALATS